MQIVYSHTTVTEPQLKDLSRFYRRAGSYMKSSTLKRINTGVLPSNAPLTVAVKRGSRTLRDSGLLMASITSKSTASQAYVGTNHVAAKTNQFGAVIKAKKKWLLIPASSETRKLQRRFGYRPSHCIENMKKAGYAIWWQTNSTTGVVMARTKDKERSFVLFITKKSVKIPARPFLVISAQDASVIMELLRTEVRRGIN